jgi:hypothetical protein
MVSDLFARQLMRNQQASATKGGKLGLDEEGIPLGSLWYSNHLEERFDG